MKLHRDLKIGEPIRAGGSLGSVAYSGPKAPYDWFLRISFVNPGGKPRIWESPVDPNGRAGDHPDWKLGDPPA